MKIIRLFTIIYPIFFLSTSSFSLFAAEISSISLDTILSESAWKLTKKSRGISHYKQPIKEYDVNAYKGVLVIDRPLETIYSLVTNVENHPLWVTFCSSSSTIRKNSEDDAIQYYRFDVPWPFLNRDIVVHCTQKTDPVTGTVTIDSQALKTPMVPLKKNHLRITDAKHKWIFERIDQRRTKVTFISMTNMEGQTPRALKNLISQVIPSSSLENLKAISMKPDHPATSTYIAKTVVNKKR